MIQHITDFTSYVELQKKYSPNTVLAYRNDILSFVTFTGHLDPSVVTIKIARSFLVYLKELKTSNKSINRKVSCLRSFFKYLIRKGTCSRNPFSEIKLLKIQKKLPEVIQDDLIRKILNNKPDVNATYSDHRDYTLILLLYMTGMRRSELITIKDNHISHSGHYIKVTGKGNKERLIPIQNQTLQALETFQKIRDKYFGDIKKCDNLFLSEKGKPLYGKLIYNVVRSTFHSITSKNVSPHQIRHSFATQLMNNNAELNAVKDLLGHSSLAATQVYTHNSIERMREVYRGAHPRA